MTLFVIGSLGFWLLLAVEFIILLALVEYEKPFLGFLSLVGVAALLQAFGDLSLLELVKQQPMYAAGGAVAYSVAGAFWAIFKWYFFVKNRKEEYLKAKAEFEERTRAYKEKEAEARAQDVKVTHFNSDHIGDRLNDWERSFDRARFLNKKQTLVPLPGEHKHRILVWIGYWPWSMLWTLINDSVKRLYKFIYENISGTLLRISNAVFKDVT